MKKLSILLVSLFSIFIISDRVEALSFNVNGVNYNVNNAETMRDYAYFTYVKDKNYNGNSFNYLIVKKQNNYYYLHYGYASSDFYVDVSNPYSGSIYTRGRTCTAEYNNYTLNSSPSCFGSGSVGLNTAFQTIVYSNIPLYSDNTFSNIYFNSNYTFYDIEFKYGNVSTYDIKYYLNNELYDTITVEGGSSHTLKDNPSYNSSTQYWSGWTYDSNIDLSNITSDVNIYGTVSDKPIYQVKYYINNELYHTDNVIEGDSYTITDYSDYNSYTHTFSGWTYDSNIDLSNVRQNIDIYGTLTEKEKIPVYIDFPISKNDFYSLMVLIGVLILTQIFRVVFPTKGGKDL